MKNQYFETENRQDHIYKLNDFTLENEPLLPEKPSPINFVENVICKTHNYHNLLYDIPEYDDWTHPDPNYA